MVAPVAHLAPHHDGALVPPDNPQNRRHPQTAACELGGEKGVEETLIGLLIHPATRIRRFYISEAACRRLLVEPTLAQVRGIEGCPPPW